MAGTATQINRQVPGNSFETKTVLAGDAAYPTGGYPFTAQQLGFISHIRRILDCSPVNFASAAVVPVLIEVLVPNSTTIASLTLQLQNFATGAELAAGANASTYSYNVVAEGV